MPGDFTSAEARARVSYEWNANTSLSVTGGFNNQHDVDYPGRLLDADHFDVYDLSAQFRWADRAGRLQGFEGQLYLNTLTHGMTNAQKPTASAGTFPNGNPRPPLVITVDTEATNFGGRAAADLAAGDLDIVIGTDLYVTSRDATRGLEAVMPSGMQMVPPFYTSDEVWPDVTILDAGLFAKAAHSTPELQAEATVRLDVVEADAGRASQDYLDAVGASSADDLSASEANLSGALTITRALTANWSLAGGVGSVVRTADPMERYSDRIPASKSQTSAEFLGNPDLKPERSTQLDVWLDGGFDQWSVSLNGFYRQMSDYITLESTTEPKLLPLSPNTVFRYRNGDATFVGGEVSTNLLLTPDLALGLAASYLHGTDDTLDEPAIGIAPLNGRASIRFAPADAPYHVEVDAVAAGKQDRVATTRGEVATDGHVRLDLRAGLDVLRNATLLAGVNNLLDEYYVEHLNASNPFSGTRIAEPGRVLFVSARVRF